MKIHIGVGGRFHSSQMAQALLAAGHDLTLCTTLPASRFKPIPAQHLRSYISYEIAARILGKLRYEDWGDYLRMTGFSRRYAAEVRREKPEVVIGWSGFAQEAFLAAPQSCKIVVRGSCHIAFQDQILAEEYAKLGLKRADRSFVTKREESEYRIADYILVPSRFARQTFLDRGIPAEKVKCIWLGVDAQLFTPAAVRPPTPLKIVNFGFQSVRKGITYLLEATAGYRPEELELHLIGDIEHPLRARLAAYPHVHLHPSMPREALNTFLAQMHVFVLPSLEEGFAQALIQAMAAGLVPLATANAGSSEMIEHGRNGYIIPIRSATAIREHLEELRANPATLSRLSQAASLVRDARSWKHYGQELTQWIASLGTAGLNTASTPRVA